MIVDGHCDTIKKAFEENISIDDIQLGFNLTDAKLPMIQMMAIYISPEEENEGFDVAKKIIKKLDDEKDKFKNRIVQIYSSKDIEKVNNNQVGLILATENGSVIQENLENVDKLYEAGVRIMSIVWNNKNELASGAMEKEDEGLTELGIEFVKYLNQKNILVDVSHSSVKTFWDTSKISSKPIVASHSCVYNLCHHPRNLQDEQIKQIAKMNGIIGIAFCSSFLSENNIADISNVIEHIKYIKNLVGIDYVGIGSDFDGLEKEHILNDMKGIKDIDNLIDGLKAEGFCHREIEKVLGDNWIRVLKDNI